MNTAVLKQGRLLSVVIGAIILVAGAIAIAVPSADAASLTSMSLTMTDSRPGQTGVEHTIDFTASGIDIRAVKLEYCTLPSGSCVAPTGFDTDAPTINSGLTTPNAVDTWSVTSTTNTITISDGTPITDTAFSITFDDLINVGTTSDTAATVFFIRITTYAEANATSGVDGTSTLASVVVPRVSVSGTQDAILEMTVAAVGNGVLADGTAGSPNGTTTATSTATSLPFGTFKPLDTAGAASRILAQTVTVSTNGSSGYSVTIKGNATSTGGMTRSGGGGSISYVTNDTEWNDATSGGTIGFGISADGGGAPANFDNDTNDVLENFGAGAALPIASNGSPVSGQATTVVFRVQVEATQASGDYSGSLDYTTLPNF